MKGSIWITALVALVVSLSAITLMGPIETSGLAHAYAPPGTELDAIRREVEKTNRHLEKVADALDRMRKERSGDEKEKHLKRIADSIEKIQKEYTRPR